MNIKTVPFMFDIPENTVELGVVAKIYKDGQIQTCSTEITDLAEVRKGMVAGEEYDDAHACSCCGSRAGYRCLGHLR